MLSSQVEYSLASIFTKDCALLAAIDSEENHAFLED
jgi:hypothetical protein